MPLPTALQALAPAQLNELRRALGSAWAPDIVEAILNDERGLRMALDQVVKWTDDAEKAGVAGWNELDQQAASDEGACRTLDQARKERLGRMQELLERKKAGRGGSEVAAAFYAQNGGDQALDACTQMFMRHGEELRVIASRAQTIRSVVRRSERGISARPFYLDPGFVAVSLAPTLTPDPPVLSRRRHVNERAARVQAAYPALVGKVGFEVAREQLAREFDVSPWTIKKDVSRKPRS